MEKVFTRVCTWNSRRYEQVYNHELSVALLNEEHREEWLIETEKVKKLDALCDTVFVAMGVIWKTAVDGETLELAKERTMDSLQGMLNYSQISPGYLIGAHIDAYAHDNDYPVVDAMTAIINLAFCEMQCMGLTIGECEEAMLVVCDSNDSKSIVKTASNVKANKDKGALFVAPELRLQQIINKAEVRNESLH